MDRKAIEALLKQVLEKVTPGSTIALVIIVPPDRNGWQAGYVLDYEMDPRAREYAADCLRRGSDGPIVRRLAH